MSLTAQLFLQPGDVIVQLRLGLSLVLEPVYLLLELSARFAHLGRDLTVLARDLLSTPPPPNLSHTSLRHPYIILLQVKIRTVVVRQCWLRRGTNLVHVIDLAPKRFVLNTEVGVLGLKVSNRVTLLRDL